MTKKAFLIGAGEGFSDTFLPKKEDLVIAVDGGLHWCEEKAVLPALAVGDFDSLSFVPSHIPVLRLPVEKDDTDMRVAVCHALGQRCDTVHIFGGTGGRPDHTFANYQVLLQIAKADAMGFLWGNTHLATVFGKGKLLFPKKEKGDLSLFAFGGDARGVSVKGAKYTAEGITLAADYPLGVSNFFMGETVEITVEEGFLLVFWGRDGDTLPVFATI